MAVFTEVSFDEAAAFLCTLGLGELQSITGCSGGIENTNYFVQTNQGDYVLTLFERLTSEQLPFYLHLMKHLAQRGIPVPNPEADKNANILLALNGKPAAVVNKLRGSSELAPTTSHCMDVGSMLARMHLAGLDYARRQPNLRGLQWCNDTVPVVLPHITSEQRQLLLSELDYQNHAAVARAQDDLPSGPIHADLFRDNVMFEGGNLTGFFDFYFAGHDCFLFDIGVCLNDWCVDLATGHHNAERARAFLSGYQTHRSLTPQEHKHLPSLLRAGALRFWLSRLWDFHLPREASVLSAHDPAHFERILRARLNSTVAISADAF